MGSPRGSRKEDPYQPASKSVVCCIVNWPRPLHLNLGKYGHKPYYPTDRIPKWTEQTTMEWQRKCINHHKLHLWILMAYQHISTIYKLSCKWHIQNDLVNFHPTVSRAMPWGCGRCCPVSCDFRSLRLWSSAHVLWEPHVAQGEKKDLQVAGLISDWWIVSYRNWDRIVDQQLLIYVFMWQTQSLKPSYPFTQCYQTCS
jgi:hypothetical protein